MRQPISIKIRDQMDVITGIQVLCKAINFSRPDLRLSRKHKLITVYSLKNEEGQVSMTCPLLLRSALQDLIAIYNELE